MTYFLCVFFGGFACGVIITAMLSANGPDVPEIE